MTEQTTQTAAPDGIDGEDLQKKLEELNRKNQELAASVSRLTTKNEEIIGENRKKSRIDKILKALDINPEEEDAEEVLLQKLGQGMDEKIQALKSITQQGAPPSSPASVTPQDLEMKSQLKLLQKKLTAMEEKAKEAERREQEAIEKRKRDYVELKVKEALQKAGCIQPGHLFQLKSDSFRLSEDGQTVIGGPEHDPRSLEDQIESFKDDSEWSMYFRGAGASGSGMAKGQGGFGGQSLKNPFRSDQLNVTEAAAIFSKDPEKAKRLILEARSAGKLDPKLASLAGI